MSIPFASRMSSDSRPGEIEDSTSRDSSAFEWLRYPGIETPLPIVAPPVMLSRTTPQVVIRPPTIGEHTDQLLATWATRRGNRRASARRRHLQPQLSEQGVRSHIEMAPLDLDNGWVPLSGFDGLETQVLADDLDERTGTGARSRLVRFSPGTRTRGVLSHAYWEEVFVISGDLYPIADGEPGACTAPVNTIRPPGTAQGPFASRAGCTLLEVQYFVK
jgi:hypothetical protein